MKPLAFKIKNYEGSDEEYEKSYKEYISFLKKQHKRIDPALLCFFGNEFFHDGIIEDFRVSNSFKDISFRIMGPNLQLPTGNGEYGYANAWFKCILHKVAWFNVYTYKYDKLNNPLDDTIDQQVTFLYSEINTLDEEIAHCRKSYKKTFQSLLINTLSCRYIGFVFEHMSVEPEEPLAFEIALREPINKTLFYSPKQ